MKKLPLFLSLLAAVSLFLSRTTLAGMPNAAGTLLGHESDSRIEIVTVIGLAIVLVGVVVYFKRRNSK